MEKFAKKLGDSVLSIFLLANRSRYPFLDLDDLMIAFIHL